jgi:iron complex outermembrane receptor protein
MNLKASRRASLCVCTALVSTLGIAGGIFSPAFAAGAASGGVATLDEVVVTAQRREQNVQDIAVAVTALTQSTIQNNRITSVNDLNRLAPGFNVVPSVGGTQIPSFSMRGVTSYGVVPGSDKSVSIYVDGIYLSAARGAIFDLPDIAQIEVLRGPQGTLFGRNATAGAVNITTRDPTGIFHVVQDVTVGNYNQFRSRTTLDLPKMGDVSAYVSFVHNERNGDIRNAGAGTVWNYSNATSSDIHKTETSPKYLGSQKANDVFVAVKYQPIQNFSAVYKYDYSKDEGSPEGNAFLASGSGGVSFVLSHQPTPVLSAPDGKRPKVVNNSFSIPRYQTNQGHTLTLKYEGPNFTIKNIAGYRESLVVTSDQLDGIGGLVNLFPPNAGAPYVFIGITNQTRSRQWSDELQAVYRSDLVTLTVGGLLFQSKDGSGAIPGTANNVSGAIPGGVIPADESVFFNKAHSAAAYAQGEFHVRPNFDIIAGIRETKDWKSGYAVLKPALANPGFEYVNTRPSYLIGANWKPMENMLVYGKYSTAFVSGGKVAGIPFAPETVNSYEAGFKGEFFEHRLRTNVAVYDATYYHRQTAQGGGTFKGADLLLKYPFLHQLGTFVLDQGGSIKSRGVEAELTYLVRPGVTVGSNISYTKNRFINPDPITFNPDAPIPTLIPPWSVSLFGEGKKSLGNGLDLSVRVDATWRDDIPFFNPASASKLPAYAPYFKSPATWVVNARASIGGFHVGGLDGEVALWSKNLFDDKSLTYALLITGLDASGNFQAARTFGVDLHVRY